MKPIPDIVKEFVLKTQGRMPTTEQEVNDYLDLINLCNRYVESLRLRDLVGKRMMKKLGFKLPEEIKKRLTITKKHTHYDSRTIAYKKM